MYPTDTSRVHVLAAMPISDDVHVTTGEAVTFQQLIFNINVGGGVFGPLDRLIIDVFPCA